MKVYLKCFASLSDNYECDYKDSSPQEVSSGQTVEDLIQKKGISKEEVKVIFVNGKKVNFDTALNDGDQIGLAPAVGGM
jgi:molybdopterin converting factor small subunit